MRYRWSPAAVLRRRGGPESGFSLVEVLVALFTLVLVSTATAGFMISAVRTTAGQSDQESALALATRALEQVQAVPVSTLLGGRSQSEVQALLASPGIAPLVVEDVVAADNYDPSATAATAKVVPITSTQTLRGSTLTVRTALNRCWLSNTTKKCTRAQPEDAVSVFRATVNVTWGPAGCGTRCSYSASALLDGQADPLFSIATSQPIIVTTTPSSAEAGTSVPVVLTGVAFANGARLAVGTGGGSFTGVARPTSTGRKLNATWAAGTGPGRYTLELVNPDTGRAEYSSMTVLPDANDDCSTSQYGGALYAFVLGNDVPRSQGTVAIVDRPAGGTAGIDYRTGQPAVYYVPDASDTASRFTLTYTVTVNEQVSRAATVTLKRSGSC